MVFSFIHIMCWVRAYPFLAANHKLGQINLNSIKTIFTYSPASPVIDKPTQLKTIFTYSPASPVIDKPTQLRFDVVQLQNGTKLGNLSARVIVLSTCQWTRKSFIFPKVVSNNGSFSVTYLFQEFLVHIK